LRGFLPIVIVDLSIAKNIDDTKKWRLLKDKMQKNKMEIVETPEGSCADYYMLQYADDKIKTAEKTRIVSRDNFTKYYPEFPWLLRENEHVVKFIIKNGKIVWYQRSFVSHV